MTAKKPKRTYGPFSDPNNTLRGAIHSPDECVPVEDVKSCSLSLLTRAGYANNAVWNLRSNLQEIEFLLYGLQPEPKVVDGDTPSSDLSSILAAISDGLADANQLTKNILSGLQKGTN